MNDLIAFIGGGNMATAIIQGMLTAGFSPECIAVVEPHPPSRDLLHSRFGLQAHAQAGDFLAKAVTIVWAVKPQFFESAAQEVGTHTRDSLHISVAAGIRTDSMARWLGNERIIRSMPNTPALIGKGITGLYARPAATTTCKERAQKIIESTGDCLWLDSEDKLDAVTAISGSGPAYLFFFMEAMTHAGQSMGLSTEQAYQLAVSTCIGAGELAKASTEPAEVLRQRVTSKGGTTYAAISHMETTHIKTHFEAAMHAAYQRAKELGKEFGGETKP
jgi:pyrroline-5-carboxylate reductase